ncbi:MAG TPA: metallophosphoesterase family protein [Gemmatimonadaceae bacterium]|nr:metallophosphoesterase family protein [Gemmatimonadaceae bacterium]
MVIGLISDTHGLVRPDVHTALAGVEVILHAGDVGGQEILDELSLIAPVQAVYGNTDGQGALGLPAALDVTLAGLRVHVSHGHELGRPRPPALAAAYDADVVVYGHTHVQIVSRVGQALVVNPGAAGPRRFDLLPSVARLTITGAVATAELISLRG